MIIEIISLPWQQSFPSSQAAAAVCACFIFTVKAAPAAASAHTTLTLQAVHPAAVSFNVDWRLFSSNHSRSLDLLIVLIFVYGW